MTKFVFDLITAACCVNGFYNRVLKVYLHKIISLSNSIYKTGSRILLLKWLHCFNLLQMIVIKSKTFQEWRRNMRRSRKEGTKDTGGGRAWSRWVRRERKLTMWETACTESDKSVDVMNYWVEVCILLSHTHAKLLLRLR